MCRWLAYTGSPILLTNVLYTPVHSLIDQSLHSKLGAETTNGDGFGIGWYDACRAEPGLGQDPADCALSGSMAQAEQLALDPAVSPSRVLPGQVQGQIADLLGDSRASRPARVGPFPFDQTTVPGEQGAGRHDPMSPQALRLQSCQCSEHTAVGPIRLRASDLTSQYRDLMPQHQNLQILRAATTGEQREPGDHARHGEVYEAEEHELRG